MRGNDPQLDRKPEKVPDDQKVTGTFSGTPGANTMNGAGTSGGTMAGGDSSKDNPENTAKAIEKAHSKKSKEER